MFALDVPNHPAVAQRLERYLETQRAGLQQALERAVRLRRFIGIRLEEQGLPPELLFLPVLESRYSVRAVSRTGAAGLWQIARSTCGAMGLRNDEWLDERRDFWKSTEAALSKLREDRERFGDWSLALAAYNCGGGCIARIIGSSGIRDFWQLRDRGLLPPETAEYVPAFFALARICSSPQRYGLSGDWRQAPQWERVELRKSVDLELLAEALELNPETLREANAELKTPITPPEERGYRLKVPAGLGARVEMLLADPQTPLLRYRYHRLRSGDTLYGLARSYGVHLSLLEQANPGLDPHRLSIGTLLRVPVAGEGPAAPGAAAAPGAPAQALAQTGPLAPAGTSAPGAAGSPVPSSAAIAGPGPRPADLGAEAGSFTASYTIASGDTLWSIARRYGLTPEGLAEVNGRALDGLLKPGETLRVPGSVGGAQ